MASRNERRKLEQVSFYTSTSDIVSCSVQSILTKLFQLRKLPDLATELPIMNDKLLYVVYCYIVIVLCY